MSVSLLLGLVYLISDSGFQKKSNQEIRNPGKERLSGVNDPSYSENQRPQPAACQIERLFLENDFHSFARELRTGEAPLT